MKENKNDWYGINDVEGLDSPALVIYIERVKQNIAAAINMIGDVNRLRPHIKTNKSEETAQLMIGAGITKFKCATIAEAETLGICHAKDVLLAYQPIGPKVLRFISVIQKYPATKFSCLVDDIVVARQIAETISAHKLDVPVYLDLNVGQNRTGIEPGDEALQLYLDCSKLNGVKPVGLHVYDGHIRDLDWNLRKQNCDKAFALVDQMKDDIVKKGLPEPVIIAGGSPTYSIHSKRKSVECSPGTFVYWDKGYADLCPEQPFLPAALVITRIVSAPTPTKLCLDLGHKSVAAENEISRRVFFLNAPELKAVSQSEEHLVVDAPADHSYKRGDVLYGLPYHICPTVALYERAYTVQDRHVSGEWRVIARDRKITI